MVKIYEHQSEDKNNSFQDRIIEYSSWDDYVRDIQEVDGTNKQLIYASIPRQTKVNVINISNGTIEFDFIHRVFNHKINCISKLIDKSEDN